MREHFTKLTNYYYFTFYGIKYHLQHINAKLCLFIFSSLIISFCIYLIIPYHPESLSIFLAEQVSLYNLVDSYPQRIAYNIFLVNILVIAFLYNNFYPPLQKNFLIYFIFFSILILSALITIWISELGWRGNIVLYSTILVALITNFTNQNWIGWTFIITLIITAFLPGFLHTPAPQTSALIGFDQHYDAVLYRGRQLANGYLYYIDSPAIYGLLWTTLIGIYSKVIQTPTFANLIRMVQISQCVCFIAFTIAAWCRTYNMNNKSRLVTYIILAIAIIPWLSTDGLAVWLPNQSGIRFLMLAIAVCISFLLNKTSSWIAGVLTGATVALALIANFETGIAATAGLGLAWLVSIYPQSLAHKLYSLISGIITFTLVLFCFIMIYHYYFHAWLLVTNSFSITSILNTLNNGFGGMKLPFRPLVIIIGAHASYIVIQTVGWLIKKNDITPNLMSVTIATIILVWLPYYINRPDDWNLWTFIALYSLLIAPIFANPQQNLLAIIFTCLLVLPVAARNLPYFIIDPIISLEWQNGYKAGCAAGIVLPIEYCDHLYKRAMIINQLKSKGSIAWSTVLPILTDQTANTPNIFWSGNIFGLSVSNEDLKKIVNKIQRSKVTYLLFDDPNDQIIQPRTPEVAFNKKLLSYLKKDYCQPQLQNGWLVAKRIENGHC